MLCAPKHFRHYHSPDNSSWDEWRLSDSERIDLENAASPEEADELEEITADENAVKGYYVVAGIAVHEYKQGWTLLTLWDRYGLSEATWEPMSAFIQSDGSINRIFRFYLVGNSEGELLTHAETLSQRKKKTNLLVPLHLLFSNLPGVVSTLVQMNRPTQCVLEQAQDSCRARVTVNGLTPTLDRARHSRHLHIHCLRSLAPTLAVPCSLMPAVISVNKMAAYQVCKHPATLCLVDHVLHGICPNVTTFGS